MCEGNELERRSTARARVAFGREERAARMDGVCTWITCMHRDAGIVLPPLQPHDPGLAGKVWVCYAVLLTL